jgi:hypothetical protein
MTVYAFASFIGYRITPLPIPLNLFFTGAAMVTIGHILKSYFQK